MGELSNLDTTDKSSLVSAINEVFQYGNNAKQELVAALLAKGLQATTDMSFNELCNMVENIVLAEGNATVDKVLSGKTFVNSTGQLLTGTLPNRGSITLSPNGTTTGSAGYYSSITIKGDSNLKASNILTGTSVLGVNGSYPYNVLHTNSWY